MHLSGGGYGQAAKILPEPYGRGPRGSFGKLDGSAAQLANLAAAAARETLGLRRNLVPAAWQVFEAYALGHQPIYPCPRELLVSSWPLVQVMAGVGMFSRKKPKHAKNSSKKRLLQGSRK